MRFRVVLMIWRVKVGLTESSQLLSLGCYCGACNFISIVLCSEVAEQDAELASLLRNPDSFKLYDQAVKYYQTYFTLRHS